jgi:hypothetical protein
VHRCQEVGEGVRKWIIEVTGLDEALEDDVYADLDATVKQSACRCRTAEQHDFSARSSETGGDRSVGESPAASPHPPPPQLLG